MFIIKKNFKDLNKIVYLNDLIMDIEEAQEMAKRLNANVCDKVNYQYELVPNFRDFVDDCLKFKKINSKGKNKYRIFEVVEGKTDNFIGILEFNNDLQCKCEIMFVIKNTYFEDKKKYYSCINAINQTFTYPNLYHKIDNDLVCDIMQTLFIKTHLYLKRSTSAKRRI